jgi:hypothetical protein
VVRVMGATSLYRSTGRVQATTHVPLLCLRHRPGLNVVAGARSTVWAE